MANRYIIVRTAQSHPTKTHRGFKKSFIDRGFPLIIAIIWLTSLAAYAVTRADAGAIATAPKRAASTHIQPLHAVLFASVVDNPGRAGAGPGLTPADGSGAIGTPAALALAVAGVSKAPFLAAVVQSPPHPVQTKPGVTHNPRKPTRPHKHAATHLVKASYISPAHTLQVWVTGYDLSGITATGVPAGPGICAVDPYTIPLGTHITIAGVGSCVAADTGPSVVGAHVDVWVPDYQTAVNLTGWYTASW